MKKSKMIYWLAGILIAGVTIAMGASTSLETSGFSAYSSRGRTIDNKESVQPSLTAFGDFMNGTLLANAWANAKYDNKGSSDFFNEVDLTLEYGRTIANYNLAVGIIEYAFSDPNLPDTHEVYLSANKNMFGLNVFSTVYYDCRAAEGYYVMAGIKKNLIKTAKTLATIDTAMGYADANYNDYYFVTDKAALNDWNSGVTITYSPSTRYSVVTGLRYVTLVNDDIRNGSREYFYGADMVVGKIGLIINF